MNRSKARRVQCTRKDLTRLVKKAEEKEKTSSSLGGVGVCPLDKRKVFFSSLSFGIEGSFSLRLSKKLEMLRGDSLDEARCLRRRRPNVPQRNPVLSRPPEFSLYFSCVALLGGVCSVPPLWPDNFVRLFLFFSSSEFETFDAPGQPLHSPRFK